jgi:hypothetical protein
MPALKMPEAPAAVADVRSTWTSAPVAAPAAVEMAMAGPAPSMWTRGDDDILPGGSRKKR